MGTKTDLRLQIQRPKQTFFRIECFSFCGHHKHILKISTHSTREAVKMVSSHKGRCSHMGNTQTLPKINHFSPKYSCHKTDKVGVSWEFDVILPDLSWDFAGILLGISLQVFHSENGHRSKNHRRGPRPCPLLSWRIRTPQKRSITGDTPLSLDGLFYGKSQSKKDDD